jgi:hypothetical protein
MAVDRGQEAMHARLGESDGRCSLDNCRGFGADRVRPGLTSLLMAWGMSTTGGEEDEELSLELIGR